MEYEVVHTFLPAIIIFVPIIAGIALFLFPNKLYPYKEYICIGVTGLFFVLVLSMYPAIKNGNILLGIFQYFSFPLSISFKVDPVTIFLGIFFSFVWFMAACFSPGYMSHEHKKERYYAFFLMAEGGCMGTIFAGDLLGLFLFFEFMALTTYVLIAHEETPVTMFAGAKYLYMTVGGGLSVFFGLLITFYLTGTVTFTRPGLITEASPLATAAFVGFMIGFGLKAGMFPVHVWLPDAHPAAPSPVSAALSGIMLKTGIYGMIRVVFNIYNPEFIASVNWDTVMLVFAGITILLGSAMALLQDDLKRRLAYSSIAQIGYIAMGIFLLNESGMAGGLYHLFTHAFMKGLLFLCAGAIIVQTGIRNISQMKGIGLKMPLTMTFFTIASVTMVGIPPFNGFISKWQLSIASLEAGQPIFVAILIISSLLNAAYYFPIVITAFFPGEKSGHHGDSHGEEDDSGHLKSDSGSLIKNGIRWQEAPWHMLVPMGLLAVGCVAFALMPFNWPWDLALAAAKSLFSM
ncbi:MAG: proton-conducting transporter membrane subunit [Bacillota bacterium]|nr:proton-conducting transporter membrane subunit [Bacillota bacterium]